MDALGTMSRLVLLAGLVFLGFYVFGVIMGVFAPGEMVLFSVIAVGVVVTYAIHAVRLRRPMDEDEERALRRELSQQRERRGF
jgi:hypothetical protein